MNEIFRINTIKLYNSLFSRISVNENGSNEFQYDILYELDILKDDDIHFLMYEYDNKNDDFKNLIDKILFSYSNKNNFINLYKKYITDEIELFLKKMPYKMFLNTYYWLTIATYLKVKFNNKCQLCNSSHSLNVHHRDYLKKGQEYKNLNDLIVLCNKCHFDFHKKGGKK